MSLVEQSSLGLTIAHSDLEVRFRKAFVLIH